MSQHFMASWALDNECYVHNEQQKYWTELKLLSSMQCCRSFHITHLISLHLKTIYVDSNVYQTKHQNSQKNLCLNFFHSFIHLFYLTTTATCLFDDLTLTLKNNNKFNSNNEKLKWSVNIERNVKVSKHEKWRLSSDRVRKINFNFKLQIFEPFD